MEIELHWMNDLLMVVHEVEKTRRAHRDHRKEEPSPTRSRPPETGQCSRKRTSRRYTACT